MSNKELWMIENIPDGGVDILNSEFVDSFIKEFNPKFKETYWGAYKCPALNRLLRKMYDKTILSRSRLGLGCNWQPGFPRWVYVYDVRECYKQ